MLLQRLATSTPTKILGLATFPVVCGLLAIALGQDLNPDTLSYHLYDAWAFLHGQDLRNVFPAGAQSLLNPFIEVPQYGLRMYAPPLLAAFVIGAWQGIGPMLVYLISRRITGSRIVALAAGVIAVIAGGFLSELGSQLGDSTVATFLLAAVFCAVVAIERRASERDNDVALQGNARHSAVSTTWFRVRPSIWLFVLAGVFAGIGAGLKLAEVSMAIGIVAAAISVSGAWWKRISLLLSSTFGFVVGILAAGGYWSYFLWRHFGDPFAFTDGPLWFFKSPYYLTATAGQYASPDYGKYLWFPIKIFFHPSLVAEIPLREASIPIAWGLFLVLVVMGALLLLTRFLRYTSGRLLKAKSGQDRSKRAIGPSQWQRDADWYVIVVFVVTVAVWMRMFVVYRYLIPAELLAPVAIIAIGRRIKAFGQVVAPRLSVPNWSLGGAFCGIAALCATTQSANSFWVRVPYSGTQFKVATPSMLQNHDTNLLVELSTPNPEGFVLTLLHSKFIAIGSFGWEHNTATNKLLARAFATVRRTGGNYVAFWTGQPVTSHWAQYLDSLGGPEFRMGKCVTEPIHLGTFTENAGFCQFYPAGSRSATNPTRR